MSLYRGCLHFAGLATMIPLIQGCR